MSRSSRLRNATFHQRHRLRLIAEPTPSAPAEDSASEWAGVKRLLAGGLSPIAHANWIAPTRQLDRDGSQLRVWVPDEVTKTWLEQKYALLISATLPQFGVTAVEYVNGSVHDHRPG